MNSNDASFSIDLANYGLIIEKLAQTASELVDSGYIKLDKKALERFAPAISIVEILGAQVLSNPSTNENLKKVLEGAYRCKVNGKTFTGKLSHAKNASTYRGIYHGNSGIKGHAEWEKMDPNEIAKTLSGAPTPEIVAVIFAALSMATCQYYLHEINGNYVSMCSELELIKEQFAIQDESEILAGQKSIANMVNHFESILESEQRCQSESIKAGQLELDALTQIERSKLKLDKGFKLDSKKDKTETIESNVNGLINTLALLKTSIYVYGMAKGLRVCFDGVESQDEVYEFINEISEQIDLYQDAVEKTTKTIDAYLSEAKEVGAVSKENVGVMIPLSIVLGPLSPAVAAGYGAYKLKAKGDRDAKLDDLGKSVEGNVSLKDVDCLAQSVSFLEDYASSLDSEIEVVSCENDYYIRPKPRDGKQDA